MKDEGREMDDMLMAAVAAVRRAARVCRAVQAELVTADSLQKKDKSPVTVADFASQAVICRALAAATPDVPVVGEEDAADLRGDDVAELRRKVVDHVSGVEGTQFSEDDVLAAIDRGGSDADPTGRFWTLDPIDGTKGFLRKEQYAIALALVEQGKPVLGVLGCPNLPMPGRAEVGVLMVGRIGSGTTMLPLDLEDVSDATPVKVSDVLRSADARFCESVESGHSDQGASQAIADALGITEEPVRMDSQCKYAAVARGDASIYLRLPTSADYREKIWDHAAGMVCVEAAGGTVTDAFGKPLDFARGRKLEMNQGIIASNGRFHATIVRAVQAQFA